ncbi:hypothetical protein CGMCC3_g7480 [Colletotrichum fructicola]|uniref:Uncharacterized protein n=1 Tax=Colletotrichum fructicola (strain Nara gc5) TaxID=1213859 RepID=A0A7J6J1A3_COLFN|nr:uncharacterized protein CGMCC3_g7480 [Colletotrichum fructicola]KAE9576346.1 hypothetical protein CGMCC3_g7480 [Colletotrichum fructicola]KAF4482665.1 hypothetical protein CGGC5_v008782 [Colletotrichum fructicola Nara gc5]
MISIQKQFYDIDVVFRYSHPRQLSYEPLAADLDRDGHSEPIREEPVIKKARKRSLGTEGHYQWRTADYSRLSPKQ